MMKKQVGNFLWLLSGVLSFVLLVPSQMVFAERKMTYTSSNEDFTNPERGMYQLTHIFPDGNGPISFLPRIPGESVYRVFFPLDSYRAKSLDAPALARIEETFNAIRRAGLKTVIRFAYSYAWLAGNPPPPDAPLPLVLEHIGDLSDILHKHSDVILSMEAGFIGVWGEWNNSTNNLTEPASQKAILDALLAALPSDRMVMLRTPVIMEHHFGGPLTEAQAFSGSALSRIGHHNDCFLASPDDVGTYAPGPAQPWRDYVAQQGRFTPISGETCAVNSPRSECSTAMTELAEYHWSTLNAVGIREVLDSWTAGGCMDTIKQHLGYRLNLKEATVPDSVPAGSDLELNVLLRNVGFAAMFNPRPIYAVLTHGSTRYNIPLSNVDPRRWEPGKNHTINEIVSVPQSVAPGTYTLALWLPDAADSLRNKPEYSVRFANTGVWESSTSLNVLTHTLKVTPPGTAPASPTLILREVFAFPNPAISPQEPTIRIKTNSIASIEIMILDISGEVIHQEKLSSNPSNIIGSDYHYDYTWSRHKTSGTYVAVINGTTTDGQRINGKTQFAVVR